MDISRYDHEVEFTRLIESLDWKKSEELAASVHCRHEHLPGCNKLRHLYAVAELAYAYAVMYFADRDLNEQRYLKAVCRTGGLLHEVMDYGRDFEAVVEASDEAVARLVAQITMDRRMPRPRRLGMYGNQIGLADETTQVVKLADLQHHVYILKHCENIDVGPWVMEARAAMSGLGRMQAGHLASHWQRLKQDILSLDGRDVRPTRSK